MKRFLISSSLIFLVLIIIEGGFYSQKYFNEAKSTREIILSDIPSSLNTKNKPIIPEWEIEKIEEHDDNFTSPMSKIYFSNGTELLISISPITYRRMDETQISIGNNRIKTFTNKLDIAYQYNRDNIYYSFKIKRGEKEKLIEQYINTLEI